MAEAFNFQSNLPQITRALKSAQHAAIEAACLHVKGEMQDRAPVGDSGQLRNTISYNVSDGEDIIGKVGSPLDYAMYVEYGTGEFADNGEGRKGGWVYKSPDGEFHFTRGMKPRKFMRNAFRDNKENIKTIIADHIREV